MSSNVTDYTRIFFKDLVSITSVLCLLLSIAASISTNFVAVENISTGNFSIYALYFLSVLVALAPLPLGYALKSHKSYIIPILLVTALDCSLTLIGGFYEYNSKTFDPSASLNKTVEELQSKREWCISMPSSVCRVSDLDAKLHGLREKSAEYEHNAELTTSPYFAYFSYFLTILRAIGVPIISAFLGHLLASRVESVYTTKTGQNDHYRLDRRLMVKTENPVETGLQDEKALSTIKHEVEPDLYAPNCSSAEIERIKRAYDHMSGQGQRVSCRTLSRKAGVANGKITKTVLDQLRGEHSVHVEEGEAA